MQDAWIMWLAAVVSGALCAGLPAGWVLVRILRQNSELNDRLMARNLPELVEAEAVRHPLPKPPPEPVTVRDPMLTGPVMP